MQQLIIIETSQTTQTQQVKNLLNKAHIDYKVYQAPKPSQKQDIFANYGQAIKDKQRQKELKLWDNADLDEELNKNGEWWS